MMISSLLVRDVPLLNVPVCRVSDTCGEAVKRVYAADPQRCCPLAVVALDEAGRAVGWVTWQVLRNAPVTWPLTDVLDYTLPSAYPDTLAYVAAETMRARNLKYLFVLAEGDPPRPFALVARDALEQRLLSTGPLRGTSPLRGTGPLRPTSTPPPSTKSNTV